MKQQHYKKFPGMKLTEPTTLTRLKLDCSRLEHKGYVGLLDQVLAWGDYPSRRRIAEAQNTVSAILHGELLVRKDKVLL